MELISIFPIIILIAIGIRLFAGALDTGRIEDYIQTNGGKLLEKTWSPFGRGWFGSKHERIYEIRYEDKQGNIHQATVKTSALAGVYFTDDTIVETSSSQPSFSEGEEEDLSDLMDENTRLRRRIAELELEKKDSFRRDRRG